MEWTCERCGRKFIRHQNYLWHVASHEKSDHFKNTPNQPIEGEYNTRLSMVEDAIEHLSTGSGFYPSSNPYQNINRSAIESKEDPFDKMLKQYMQIMMIKQLSQSSNSNQLTDLIKFQQFVDGREPKESDDIDPLALALLQNLSPQISNIFQKKKVNETDEMKYPLSMKIPEEKELMSMTDEEILEILKPHLNFFKSINFSEEQAWLSFHQKFPNFPEDRFRKILRSVLYGVQ